MDAKGILVSVKKKNKIYNKFCKTKDPERKRSLHETFKKYKEKHYKNYFQENKNNLCKTWQGIKQIILIKKANGKNDLKIKNTIVSDGKSITIEFNEFFGSVAKEIDKKIPKSKRTCTDYLKSRNINPLLLNPVTESEIEKIINMFSEKKAVGPHSIPTNILKEYKKILSLPLAIIINISFKTGIFPKLCKIVHIIPVYKIS